MMNRRLFSGILSSIPLVGLTAKQASYGQYNVKIPNGQIVRVIPPLVYETIKSGNWNDPTIWRFGKVPTEKSFVIVNHPVQIGDCCIMRHCIKGSQLLEIVGHVKISECCLIGTDQKREGFGHLPTCCLSNIRAYIDHCCIISYKDFLNVKDEMYEKFLGIKDYKNY